MRKLLISAVVLASATLSLPSAIAVAHTPSGTDACYYGPTLNDSRTTYLFQNGSGYARVYSHVEYKLGYDCYGRPVLAKVTYRSARYSTNSTLWSGSPYNTWRHQIQSSFVVYAYNDTSHTSEPNAVFPTQSCLGNCSFTISSFQVVYVEYDTDNHIYMYCYHCEAIQSSLIYHYFVNHTITSGNPDPGCGSGTMC